MTTLEQKIARAEDEVARLKAKKRETYIGQEIIIGGMVLSLAKNNYDLARFLLDNVKTKITRKADLRRLESVIEDLEKVVNDKNH